MIKINLLNSVTERQSGAVVAVDRKIASPASRLVVMSLVVAALLAAVIGWDVISTQMAKAEAEQELAKQKQIEADLAMVIAEQKDLEQKIQNIDMRIEAIKKLRGSQAGPSAVLEAMRERIAMTPGLYLESVEQTGEQMTFKGNSPDESQVTQFGRSLEFSNGLFSNLSIETTRAEVQNQNAPQKVNATRSLASFLLPLGPCVPVPFPSLPPASSWGSPSARRAIAKPLIPAIAAFGWPGPSTRTCGPERVIRGRRPRNTRASLPAFRASVLPWWRCPSCTVRTTRCS